MSKPVMRFPWLPFGFAVTVWLALGYLYSIV